MVAPNQPDELFPWLTAVVGKVGPFACDAVVFDPSGALTFRLRHKQAAVDVAWHIASAIPGEAPFRDGSLSASVSGADPSRAADLAMTQVRRSIDLVVQRHPVPLIERRNREVSEIALGPGTVAALCRDLLQPGITQCGVYRFVGTSVGDGVVGLDFRGVGAALRLCLAPPRQGSGTLIGRYGPLELTLDRTGALSPEVARVARFVGYVLALSTHPGMALREPDNAPAEKLDRLAPGGDRANPFLFSGISAGGILIAAMFASRGRVVPIFHADRECTGFASYLTGLTETVYLHQWGLRPTPAYLRRMRIVDTTELDAIMTGSQDKLTALVKESVEQEAPELLVVMGTCVSRVIGDSVEKSIEDAAVSSKGIPTIWLETTATERDQHHRLLWERLVELFQGDRREASSPSVNLLGYGQARSPSVVELSTLLESIGVRRNACLIPSFDIEELRRFGEAGLNLLLPSALMRDSLLWARPKLHAPVLESPAPYGLRGTLAWMRSVAEFFGLPPPDDAWVSQHLGPLQSRWDRLVRQARDVRIGIVLTSDHFGSEDPMHRAALPWFELFGEMGFGLEVFVIPAETRKDDRGARDWVAARVRHAIGPDSRHVVRWCDSMDELRESIEKSPLQLLYSEVPNDRRATSAGKCPIHYLDVDMGYEGACRSLERLLRLASTPFYRRYGSLLPPPSWT